MPGGKILASDEGCLNEGIDYLSCNVLCGRSLAGIMISNPARGHGCHSLMIVVCFQVEVSATG